MKKEELISKAKQSNRYPFIAEHRGGPLTKENHRLLMKWAIQCSEHVLLLVGKAVDVNLLYALEIAKKWERGEASTKEAIVASLNAHAIARQTENQIYKAVARSVGQTVATAHCADHSLGGAFYALKAIKLANSNVETEKAWQTSQLNQLPTNVVDIVRDMWIKKEFDKRI